MKVEKNTERGAGSGWLKFGVAGAIGLVALLMVAGLAYAGYQYLSYGNSAADAAAINTSRVSIVNPMHGETIMAGEAIVVEVSSVGAEPFQKAELWINGDLMGEQAPEDQQALSWSTNFLWKPMEPGAYQLVARSYSGDTATASRGTLIVVEPVEIMGKPDEDVPVSLGGGGSVQPAASTGGSGGSGGSGGGKPEVEPPQEQAGGWQLMPGLWMQSLTADGSPAAPVIESSVEGCQVTLWIQDQSDNEEGFLVRRQPVAAQGVEEVETLAAMAGTISFEFSHLTEAGSYSYSVRAFNSQGYSDSNPAVAEVDPADCAESSDSPLGANFLNVEMSNLQTSVPVDRSYCYRSFDGVSWERWPLTGFHKTEDGLLEGGQFKVLLDELGEQASQPELELMVECWGWVGQELTYLGSSTHGLGQPGANSLGGDLFSVDVIQDLGDSLGGTTFFPLNHEDMGFEFGLDDFKFDPKLLYTTRMLRPFAFVSYDPDACKERLPPNLQNDLGKILGCFPFPGFDVGPGGDNPQPYLLWFPGNQCIAGSGIPPCYSYSQWQDLADAVGFEVWDSAQGSFEVFDSPDWFVYNIKPYACDGTRTFQVRMWAQVDDFTVAGGWSQPVTIPCPIPNQGVTHVYVTFDQLDLINVEDGEGEPQDVEVYGVFKAWTSVDKLEIWLAGQSDWDDGCPSEAVSLTLNDMGLLGSDCREPMQEGVHSLSQVRMCEAPCPSDWYSWGHNRGTLLVPDGEKINLLYNLMDYDTASGNDQVCFHTGPTASRSYFEWIDTEDSFWMGGLFDYDNGKCKVHILLNGANVPPGPLN